MCSLRVPDRTQSAETSHNDLQQHSEHWVGSALSEGRSDSSSSGFSLGALGCVPSPLVAYPSSEDATRPRQFTHKCDMREIQHASGSDLRMGQRLGNTSFNVIRAIGPSATTTFYQGPVASSSNQRREVCSRPNPRQLACEIGMHGEMRALRSHSTPATMQWLKENYQQADGVCIPRHVIYNHYCRFCHQNGMSPVNAASFGKIIRQKFNMVKNRRLGMRGCSTYHYHGIGILATSTFYQEQICNLINSDSSIGLSPSPYVQANRQQLEASLASARSRVICSNRAPLSSLGEIQLPPQFPSDVSNSFITMYRAHCQRIYESIFGMNLQEVQEFVLHFWNGVPVHLIDILETNVVINMIGVCDLSLYGNVSDVLFPNIHKTGPPRLYEMLNKLASNFENWLNDALLIVPAELRVLKLTLARNFCRGLRRLTSLNKLCNSGHLLGNPGIMAQMLIDFRNIDLSLICGDIVHNRSKSKALEDKQIIMRLFSEFERLMELQVGVQQHLKWLDTVIDRCVVQVATKRSIPSIRVARNFLLVWVGIGTLILRDLTLISAHSFGSYHLLGLIFNDYLIHCTEILAARDQAEEMKRNIDLNTPTTLHKGFTQEERKDSNTQEFKPQSTISQFYEPPSYWLKKATHSFSEQHGPIQGFLCKQETPHDAMNSSDTRQEFQDINPLYSLNIQQSSSNLLTGPNSGPFPQDTHFDAGAVMYENSPTSPNYQSLQSYAAIPLHSS